MSDVSVRLSLQDDVSAKLSQISSSARTASSQLQQMGRQIDNAFKSKSPEQFASRLGDAAEEASDGFETLGNSVEKAMQDLERGMNIDVSGQFDDAADSASDLAEAAEKAGESVDDLASSAQGLGESVDGIGEGGDLGGLSEEANSAGESMDTAATKANTLESVLKKLFATVSAAAVLKKISDYVSDSVELGQNYTAMMSEVQAISGASAADMEQLENTARSYGATTVFSATEAAEALKYMSLAGWSANQSSSALGGVLNLAAASGMELGQASDMVTDYLSAFGMEASDATYFADMLAFAQSNSNTTAEQLGEAYRNSAANMHAAGQDVETTTSLLEAMANQGYKGSEAGTSLAAVMRDITNQMENGAIKIGDTSVSVQDASGNFRDLTDILTDVEAATYGMGDADRAAALGATFTADSIKGMNMILNEGMDKISGYEDALRSATGTSETMADTMNDNLTGDLANMNSAWEEMQLQVFEGMEDTLREGVQTLTSDYIPALTEFVPEVAEAATSGLGKIASALSPLITTVLKNPKGVAAAFTSIGAGLAAFKTAGLAKDMLTTVDGTSKLTSTLTNLGDVLTENWWAAGAALVTTSVAAIGFAIDQYNDMQIEENLNSHFGDISLDTSQIEVLAGQIVDVDFTADMHVADVWFNEAEQLVSQGEQLLAENDFLWWQINNVGLTTGAGDEIISNSEEFQKTITDAIEKDVYPATLTVEALLGDADAGPIVEQMQQWAREDTETVEAMGSAVSELLGRAFEEGADTADIEAAVQILQKKMLDIVNGLNESSLEGELKWLQFSTEGAALDEESWSGVVEKAVELQQEQESLVESEYQNTFSLLEQFAHNDESRRGTVDVMEQVLAESFSDYKQNTATGVWEKIYTSLGGIYGEELDTLQNAMESSSFKGKIEGVDFQSGLVFAQTDLEYAIQEQFKELDPGTQEILADRYESMLPTVQQMDDIISKAAEQGESVPQSMMEAYSEAMELGAAAGDTEAMWQYMANEVAQDFPSKEDFVSTLEANGMNFSDWPEEIQKCFEKAFVDTDSTVDYSSMLKNFAEAMSEDDIDWSNVESLLNEFGYSIKGALEEQGVTIEDTDIPVHADGINVDMDELGRSLEGLNYVGSTETDAGELVLKYTVDEGETLSGIMQQYGVVWSEVEEQIKEANPEIADLNMIYPDQIIKIPKAILELADIDTSGVGKAVDEAVSEATESVEAEGASTEIGIAANTTITAGENDMTAVETSVQSDLDNMDTWETDGDTQVTLEQENNADEVYSAIGTRLKTLFETPYNIPASANVSIDVDYSIANPTATISIGGSGTGTGMVTASIIGHAAGGYFDTPHLAWIAEGGAGEWIIPDDGSDRSRQMWNAAGETLGMFEGISQMPQSAYATIPESGAVGEMAASGVVERKITVELKGIGKLNISREMSKEQVADILSDNLKETLMNILQQEILEEGIGSYDY